MSRYVLADFQDFSSQSEAVQRMVNCQFASARQQGIKKIGYIGVQPIIQLQFNKLFRKRDLPQYAFFESEDEAIQWLIAE
jgi:hypothetical protein